MVPRATLSVAPAWRAPATFPTALATCGAVIPYLPFDTTDRTVARQVIEISIALSGKECLSAISQLRARPGAGCCSLPVCAGTARGGVRASLRYCAAGLCAAVLVFRENPVLLVEVEVCELVAGAGLVPEVEIPAFAVSKSPDVDHVLVDPKRWSRRCSGLSNCSKPQRLRL